MERNELEKLIEDQKQIISDASNKLKQLENNLFMEYTELDIIRKYFNTYWMYKDNCYSCPETEADYWNIYKFIYAVDGNKLKYISFEVDSFGNISIKDEISCSDYFDNTHIKILKQEFETAWELTRMRIQDYSAKFYM